MLYQPTLLYTTTKHLALLAPDWSPFTAAVLRRWWAVRSWLA